MSEFIKTQEEIRANLTMQIREVLDHAEESKRGLDQAELEKIERIETDIRRADEALEVAKRNADRAAEAAEASRGFVPAEEARGDAEIFRAMARGEVREHTFSLLTLSLSRSWTACTTWLALLDRTLRPLRFSSATPVRTSVFRS